MRNKKWMALVCCAVMGMSMIRPIDAATSEATMLEVLVMMDLVEYDDAEKKTIDEASTISRAEFAKDIYRLAGYGSEANRSYVSPYSDVPYTNQYAGYIKTVTNLGYMSAYTKGQFKPNLAITSDDAIRSLLLVLGYTNEEINQVDVLYQIGRKSGLLNNLNLTMNTNLMMKDYVRLLYNALNTSIKGNQQTLAQNMGYTLRSDSLTISDVIDADAVGPVALTKTMKPKDFGLDDPTVFINGEQKKSVTLKKGDVVYYSVKANRLYVYRNYVYGTITSISGNLEDVTSFTAGSVYKCSTDEIKELFRIGKLEVGDYVKINLDRDGNAAYASYSVKEDEEMPSLPSGGGNNSGGSDTVVYEGKDGFVYIVANGVVTVYKDGVIYNPQS